MSCKHRGTVPLIHYSHANGAFHKKVESISYLNISRTQRDRESKLRRGLHYVYVIRKRLTTYREGYGMRLVTGILLSVQDL